MDASKQIQTDEDEGFAQLKQALGMAEERNKTIKEVYDDAISKLTKIKEAHDKLMTAMIGLQGIESEKTYRAEHLMELAAAEIQTQKNQVNELAQKQKDEQQQIDELKKQLEQYEKLENVQKEISGEYSNIITSYEQKYNDLMTQFDDIIKSTPMSSSILRSPSSSTMIESSPETVPENENLVMSEPQATGENNPEAIEPGTELIAPIAPIAPTEATVSTTEGQ